MCYIDGQKNKYSVLNPRPKRDWADKAKQQQQIRDPSSIKEGAINKKPATV
jgi:hypothetical protein